MLNDDKEMVWRLRSWLWFVMECVVCCQLSLCALISYLSV